MLQRRQRNCCIADFQSARRPAAPDRPIRWNVATGPALTGRRPAIQQTGSLRYDQVGSQICGITGFLACGHRGQAPYRFAVTMIVPYLANLSRGRLILWCYFIWYGVVLARYFDPSPRLWLTSVGLSLIIGVALYLSTTATDKIQVRLDFWKTFRLFLMPFCVSSFAALVKGKGFILVFSPHPAEVLMGASGCLALCGLVFILKSRNRPSAADSPAPAAPERSLGDRS